jgi:hypothetical protein
MEREIVLDDLANPQFTPEAAALIDAVEGMGAQVDLDVDALESAAAAQVGTDDFGAPLYREPLGVLCEAISEESGMSPLGLLSAQSQLTRFLVNRLLLVDLWKEHPEIHEEEIQQPIVIVGQPRSGTTHLHNLLGADPGLRALPWWESLEPVAPPGEEGTVAGRRARAQEGIDQRDMFLPYFDAMHEMTVDHVHEEIHLLGITGSTMLFDTMGILPSWRSYYATTDQTPHYMELATILKTLQWLRGGDRWVLKSPQHLEQLGPLMAVFPDATVVFTHRDPVSIAVSMSTMVTYASRTSHAAPLDVEGFGSWWASLLADMMAACTRDRELVPAEQSIDVAFGEFMADDMGTVEAIYELADQPFTAAVRATMETYAAEHPRGRHGRILYDIGDFDYDVADLRDRFGAYVERFDVPTESW